MTPTQQLVATVIYKADYDTRSDLQNRIVASENDYVSAFCVRVRDALRALRFPIFAHAQRLPQTHERKFGCDAMISVNFGGFTKIGLFEAKWPRLSIPTHPWDYVTNTSNKSHFSDQLDRQRSWTSNFYIWEQFLHEERYSFQPRPFDNHGSSCIPHASSVAYDSNARVNTIPWTSKELTQLRSLMHTRGTTYYSTESNLYKVIASICSCKNGRRLIPKNGFVTVTSDHRQSEPIRIPVDAKQVDEKHTMDFMEQAGISNLLLMNIE